MHPGLAVAFGNLGGADSWRNKARIEVVRYAGEPRLVDGAMTFAVDERYLDGRGEELARGRSDYKFVAGSSFEPRLPGTVVLWRTTIEPGDGRVVFGGQHEMGLALRVATPVTVKNGGRILGSHGGLNEAGNWGLPGQWWDYGGTTNGRRAGCLVVASGDSSRPVWAHARDYGFLAVNPTGPPPERRDVASGPFAIETGKPLVLEFAILLYAAPEAEGLAPEPAARALTAAAAAW
jgi:hypothetical protein